MIGTNNPTYEIDVLGITNEFKLRECKVNKFNRVLFNIIKWYCTKRGITVTFQKTKYIKPNEKLHITGNGNVGI